LAYFAALRHAKQRHAFCLIPGAFAPVHNFRYMAHRLGHSAWQVGTAFVVCFVMITRLYAGSRFVHQVALSALTGSASLAYFVLNLEGNAVEY